MERIARESVEDLPEQVETIPGDLVQRQVRHKPGASMKQVAGAAGVSPKLPSCSCLAVYVATTRMQARISSPMGPA